MFWLYSKVTKLFVSSFLTIQNFKCYFKLFPVPSVNQSNDDGIVCWQKQTVMMQRTVRGACQRGRRWRPCGGRALWLVRSPVFTRLQSSISLRYRAVEFQSVSLYRQTLSLREPHESVSERKEEYKKHFLCLFASSKRGNAIDKHETGDADAHRLRCRPRGVYVRQNAGTASLSKIT